MNDANDAQYGWVETAIIALIVACTVVLVLQRREISDLRTEALQTDLRIKTSPLITRKAAPGSRLAGSGEPLQDELLKGAHESSVTAEPKAGEIDGLPLSLETPISMMFESADARALVDKIAMTYGLEIKLPDDFKGTTALFTQSLSWDRLLKNILNPLGYDFSFDGQSVTMTRFRDSESQAAALRDIAGDNRMDPMRPVKRPEQEAKDLAPSPVVQIPPAFPDQARGAGVSGTVHVQLLVDRAGKVIDARIVGAADAMLSEATLAAAGQWQFQASPSKWTPRMQVPVIFSPSGNVVIGAPENPTEPPPDWF